MPETKTRLLVGLLPSLAVACQPAFPLCDRGGAPACGNIGQLGRPTAPSSRPRTERRSIAPPRFATAASVATAAAARPLLAAGINVGEPVARPLLDPSSRPAPGNVVGKGRNRAAAPRFAGTPVGGAGAATPTAAHTTSARIVAIPDGALVIDEDSGALIATDRDGRHRGHVEIGAGAGLLTYDPVARIAYVVDRAGDRVVVVEVGARLEIVAAWRTAAEPYGIALTPDRGTLLVSMIADRALVAYDVRSGEERWRTPLPPAPRGVAISPDGRRALVASLATGGVEQIDLAAPLQPERRAIALSPAPRDHADTSVARGSFAVTYLGVRQAVVPFQREVPAAPITHELAFLGTGGGQLTAQLRDQQVRALVWDGARDALYVAGMETDTITRFDQASQRTITAGRSAALTASDEARCGPDGLAVTGDGVVLVWCASTRTVARLDFAAATMATGPSLIGSRRANTHAGQEI